MGGGREVQEAGDMCIFMADLCCMEKDNTYCKAIILLLKINFKKSVGYFMFFI